MSTVDVKQISIGEARVHCEHYRCPATDEYETDLRVIVGESTVCTMPEDCGENDPELIAEAFNVAQETGLSPRQLKERLDEAVNLLKTLYDRGVILCHEEHCSGEAERGCVPMRVKELLTSLTK